MKPDFPQRPSPLSRGVGHGEGLWLRRTLASLAILLLSVQLFAGPVLRQELQLPDPLTVGTPFTLTLSAEGADKIGIPLKDSLDNFELVSARPQSKGLMGKPPHLTLTLIAWETGELEGPVFRVPVTRGKHTETVRSDPFPVTVTTVLPDSLANAADTAKVAAALKDTLAPTPVKPGLWDILLPAALLGGLAWWLIRRHRRPVGPVAQPLTPPPPPIPAWRQALVLLDELRREKVLERGDFVEFYFRLSMILRFYIELRDGFKAMEMTTGEFRDAWLGSHEERDALLKFLREADRIKFAKHLPGPEAAERTALWLESYLKDEAQPERRTPHLTQPGSGGNA
jgi:hypothetical protein